MKRFIICLFVVICVVSVMARREFSSHAGGQLCLNQSLQDKIRVSCLALRIEFFTNADFSLF